MRHHCFMGCIEGEDGLPAFPLAACLVFLLAVLSSSPIINNGGNQSNDCHFQVP